MDCQKLAELQADQSTLAHNITDFIDEDDLGGNVNDIEDIDSCISRTEQLRSKYSCIHKVLVNLKDDYKIHYWKGFMEGIASIKCCIKAANKRKRLIQQSQ